MVLSSIITKFLSQTRLTRYIQRVQIPMDTNGDVAAHSDHDVLNHKTTRSLQPTTDPPIDPPADPSYSIK